MGLYSHWVGGIHALIVVAMMLPMLKYGKEVVRSNMRKGFFGTLIYLPIVLLGLAFAWG
jgi:hypothetical protein